MSILAWPLVGFLADLVCPERCASCDTIVHAASLFCGACTRRIRRLGSPECGVCGEPGDDPCGRCAVAPSPIRSARAWAAYRNGIDASPAAAAVVRLKYGGAQRLARRMAAAMLTRAPDRHGVDVVMPIPLHPRRLRTRGYNQSAALAHAIAPGLGAGLGLTLVERRRATPSQVGLSPRARAANVAGAFIVRRPELVDGRIVLVVDDVWTSGATARAVATSLRAAGARAVDVLTFARVL